MISLIQQYPIAAVVLSLFVGAWVGAAVGLFAAGLCTAAHAGDHHIEGDAFKSPVP